MALSVDKKASGGAYSGTITSVGVNNGGSQYSPNVIQQPKPTVQYVQNPAPASTYQPTYSPQQTAQAKAIQQAATQAQIAAAVQAQKQQAAAAAARAKAILKVQVQGQVDSKVATNLQKFKLAVASPLFKGKLKVSSKTPNLQIKLPEQSDYQKEYAKAYNEALAEYDRHRTPGKQNFFQKAFDKATFGQDRRDVQARKFAQDRANQIMGTNFKQYEAKINTYLSKQASVQAAVNKALETMTQSQFDKYVADQQAQLDAEYKALVAEGARYDGQTEAFSAKSQSPLTSVTAKALSTSKKVVTTAVTDKNPIWKYTVGGGSESVPSLITALPRLFNTAGNLNTKDRTIFKYGGTTFNRAGSNKNAWQATFNQRNANTKPWVDIKPGKQADQILGAEVKSLINARKKMGVTDSNKLDYNKVMEERLKSYNKSKRNFNSAQEVVSDPTIFAGVAVKSTKSIPFVSKLLGTAKASKPANWVAATATKLAESKPVKFLGAEVKTPQQAFFDTKTAIRDISRAEQDRLLKKITAISKKLDANAPYDLSIFDELKSLNPKELEVLQRMSGDGKLAFRDRALMMGKSQAGVRAKFEDLAKRYTAFTEQMKAADRVTTTSYGKGKKLYSPRTAWADDLDNYNFRLRRKKGIQSGEDFLHGVIDRYFKSDLDNHLAQSGAKYNKYHKKLRATQARYTQSFEKAKAEVGIAQKKLSRDTTGVFGYARNKMGVRADVSFGRSLFNTAKNIQAAPTKLWKQSVLKYRPAWTVNNVLYNTQAGVLAGGKGALVEQAKMLVSPRYRTRAMAEGTAFRSNIGKEIGTKGKLNRFYSGVEDWSRVAAGRASMKNGLTEKQAVSRVNKYLFDYKTSNWERPIKAVVPFWSFQKNLAKAAATMPFDRPTAAIGYNRLDRYQSQQFDNDFNAVIPELKAQGWTDAEIEQFRAENAKYFKGKLRIGKDKNGNSRYINTPFNAFSEKGLTTAGINPFLATGAEVADSTDSFAKKVSGSESGFLRRLVSKFPQADLARQYWQKRQVDSGKLKPTQNYIGKPGSDGIGFGKTKQGYDPSKKNYVASMDPRQKLDQNALAFLGVPRAMSFDQKGLVKSKALQKLTAAYFALDTKNMEFDQAEAERQKLFKQYGVTADEFYNGILSKYDSDNTAKIKGLKSEAAVSNKALFEEYGRQPEGTRNLWVTQKLRELNAQGYFNDNPFLKSFKYATPTSFAKADKQLVVREANRTGDWSTYRSKYGLTQKQKDYQYATASGDWSAWVAKYGKTAKASARDHAVASGDWTEYAKTYGVNKKSVPFQMDGKYFKSADSMAKYQEGKFWNDYGNATPEARKKMLADNPQYNKRGNWTAAMWLADKKTKKAELKAKAKGFGDISAFIAKNTANTTVKATRFQGTLNRRTKKVAFKL